MPAVVQNLCDPHYLEDEHVEGAPVAIKIGSLERVLILCPEHRKGFVDPLETLLREHGSKPQPAQSQPHTRRGAFGTEPLPEGVDLATALRLVEEGKCLFPDCSYESPNGKPGVGSHLRNVHDTTLTKLGLGQRGTQVLAPQERIPCGYEGCTDDFPTEQGAATHRNRKHGVKGASKRTQARRSTRRT